MLLKRIFYTLKMAKCHREQLAEINQRATSSMSDLSLSQFKQMGIKTIVFDFDGILAAHGEEQPAPQSCELLHDCSNYFPLEQIFILSNKPSEQRREFFAEHFPHIQFIKSRRKKPYPDGLLTIIEQSGSQPGEIVLIDDRLLTGALAACIAKTQVCYVANPLKNTKKRPVVESFFAALRYFERSWLK